jgi:hypothetical protein
VESPIPDPRPKNPLQRLPDPREESLHGALDLLFDVALVHGFASGFVYGLLSGASPDEAVRLGWAHGALLTTFPGDTIGEPGAGARVRAGRLRADRGVDLDGHSRIAH